MTTMIKLANGNEVSADVFYTWSASKQHNSLCPTRAMLGKTHSEETRAKMSAAKQGMIPAAAGWNKGLTHSEETRAKMSAAKKGQKGHTKNTGKTHSEEARAKMRASAKTAHPPRPVMTPLGRFASSKEAAQAFGLKSKEAILYRIKNNPKEYYYVA